MMKFTMVLIIMELQFVINNKKGLLNTSGSEIISPRYDEILNFGQSENSIVIENGLKGIISIGG